MQKEYRAAAIRANRRMTNLEKLAARDPDYKAVLEYAYGNVQYDLNALGMTGGRFTHELDKVPASKVNMKKLGAALGAVNEFLSAASSTKKGIDRTYNKRAKTINKRYGTKLNSSDMRLFFSSHEWEKLKNMFGSKTAMKIIAKVQKNAKEITKQVETARRQHKKINIDVLNDIDGLNINTALSSRDRGIIANLASIYQAKK